MKLQYKRPRIFVMDGFMEGVYAASGGTAASYLLTETDQWSGAKAYYKAYNIVCKNTTNEALSTLTVNLSVTGNVTSIISNDTAITSAAINGSVATLKIHIDDPNGLAPGASTRFLYLSITGEGDNFGIC
jgi:hypothetical protein